MAEPAVEMLAKPMTGGCQCGAVRYELAMKPVGTHFCEKCGSPLSFAYDASKWICVTVGSLDDPSQVKPTVHYGVESQLHWLQLHEELPREETSINEAMKNMAVYQYQTHG